MKKILAVCRYGNIRSVALARLLKKEKFDALACGVIPNKESLDMLCKWADKILVVESSLTQELPTGFESKIIEMNIGEDIWHDSLNPDLERVIKQSYYAKKAQIWN